jgi:hypothetical protein
VAPQDPGTQAVTASERMLARAAPGTPPQGGEAATGGYQAAEQVLAQSPAGAPSGAMAGEVK